MRDNWFTADGVLATRKPQSERKPGGGTNTRRYNKVLCEACLNCHRRKCNGTQACMEKESRRQAAEREKESNEVEADGGRNEEAHGMAQENVRGNERENENFSRR